MIVIISSKKAGALGLGDKNAWAVVLQLPRNQMIPKTLKTPAGQIVHADDQVYLDISGLSPAGLKKALLSLKKCRAGSFWGIIDPKGAAQDPALFFFGGACDYIGPALVKKGLTKKRFAAALSHVLEKKISNDAAKARAADIQSGEKQKSVTLPAGKFEGWKSLRAGATAFFFFLFVSLSGKTNLRSQVGEDAFNAIKNRLREVLQQALHEADALLWMEKEDNSIFLIPSRAPNARAAVEASLKMILNSRLISIEKLGLSFPVDFTFALHYGKSVFRAPGKTGAVVSEPVNYIFHLGAKKAEAGRLTISGEVPAEALSIGLLDLFNPAGIFEGIPIRHSRRFVYKTR